MFEFDKYIEKHIIPLTNIINKKQNRKKDGKRTKEYLKISNQKLTKTINKTQKQNLKNEIKKLSKQRIKIPYA